LSQGKVARAVGDREVHPVERVNDLAAQAVALDDLFEFDQ